MDFDEWVQLRGAALLRFAYLITRDHSRAEEAVQDALVGAYSRWPKIIRDGEPEAYLRRSIINADISGWRKFFRRETPVGEATTFDSATADHAGPYAEQDAVWRLCASLPTKQRAAVVLRYYEGLPDAEIAEILNCSAPTVRSQIHRALASLRTTLSAPEEVARR
ncbi:SigE family RNA polymerase sigma factor [Streptomyces sp. SID13031]|uniref:SigE family RNA polymerase sigma factor n=1 Tax=Streptomyces sp. SID13031 TaxID=2706046 RepID=UPI0013CB6ECD|nr:SigE family RNA polymerase sigma factor [Streptomyces sp. SID13031]NEA31793.1 SigE family RNA polymerase sigma factor [Streptomyces sp. SID13031]